MNKLLNCIIYITFILPILLFSQSKKVSLVINSAKVIEDSELIINTTFTNHTNKALFICKSSFNYKYPALKKEKAYKFTFTGDSSDCVKINDLETIAVLIPSKIDSIKVKEIPPNGTLIYDIELSLDINTNICKDSSIKNYLQITYDGTLNENANSNIATSYQSAIFDEIAISNKVLISKE